MRLVLYLGPTVSREELTQLLGYPPDDRREFEEIANYRTTQPDMLARYVRIPLVDRYRRVA